MFFRKLTGSAVDLMAHQSLGETLDSFLPALSHQNEINAQILMETKEFLCGFFGDVFEMGREYSCVESSYCLEVLRQKNRVLENKLLSISDGIATHHGAMFSMGLMSAAAGKMDALGIELQLDYIIATIADYAKNYSYKSFVNLSIKTSTLTDGEQLFLKTGQTSIRGLAEKGFEPILSVGLDYLEKNSTILSPDDLSTGLFLALVSIIDDSRIILCHGQQAMDQVKALAKSVADDYSHHKAVELDEILKQKQIVPKAAMAMHSLCLFLQKLLNS